MTIIASEIDRFNRLTRPGTTAPTANSSRASPGEALGACGAMGGKLVNAKGWCVAWVKKA